MGEFDTTITGRNFGRNTIDNQIRITVEGYQPTEAIIGRASETEIVFSVQSWPGAGVVKASVSSYGSSFTPPVPIATLVRSGNDNLTGEDIGVALGVGLGLGLPLLVTLILLVIFIVRRRQRANRKPPRPAGMNMNEDAIELNPKGNYEKCTTFAPLIPYECILTFATI